MVSVPARREQVGYATGHGLSQRRACTLVSVGRSALGYRSRKADEFSKEGLAIEVDGRIRSGRVIEVLSRLVSERGAPQHLRSDNGPEFVSRALLKWIVDQGIGTALIEPGKPWQNGVNESFNGK